MNHSSMLCRCLIFFAVLASSIFSYASTSVSVTPGSLSFGDQSVGTKSTPQIVTVTNTGTSTLFLSGINISKAGGSYFQSNTCGATLGVNDSCTISVVFDPQSIGSLTATVEVNDNASGSPQKVSLSGTGTGPAVTLSATSLSFKGVTVDKKSAVKTITVTNSGSANLTVSSLVSTGDFTQTNNCTSAAIAAGGFCTISVTFAPTEVWSRGGSIVIYDNAYGNPEQVVLLVGMANSGAAATIAPSSLSWGDQNLGTTSSAQTITLTNSGTASLNINSVLASGDFAQTNDCPSALATNASCTINVTFAPSNTGARSGYLTLNDTDPSFLQTVNLSGTGTNESSNISVNPEQASITPSQTQQFTATIAGEQSSNVTWAVDGITGGNSTVGTISTSGIYTPPTTGSAMHIVKVTNNANTTQSAVAFVAATSYAGTYTYKNDTMRTGQNLNEVALTTGNVNSGQFGKLFTYTVSGYVFAQPLYVQGVNISGKGIYNVVYVATEGDMVYAFDADNINGDGATALWQTSFVDTPGVTTVPASDVETGTDIPVQIGITATPVIDPTINTIFVLARTKVVSGTTTSYEHTLHALSMTTGEEQPGSPVQITATVSGIGSGSVGGELSFDGLRENPRPAMLIANGTVYMAWASLEDIGPYHGWIMAYNETTLQQVTAICTTPNGDDGGIWQGGGGIAADVNGNVFITTGNGTFDANVSGEDYGMSAVKYSATDGALSVADYFAPYNQATLTGLDWDLSSGGIMLLPDQAGTYPHVMLAGGKGSTVYELNRDALGGFNATADQNLLTVPAVVGQAEQGSGNRAGGPAYWQGQIYYAGSNTDPMQFSLQGSLISTIPIAQSTDKYGYPGGSPTISANGNSNGIVWIVQTDKYASSGNAILRAFDASNVSRELYDSSQDSSRDKPNAAVKFVVPTVANGKVYLGTETALDVYGLLP